jgi:hypothetical protein
MEDAEEDGELGIQHSHSEGSDGEVEPKLRAAAAPARPCPSRSKPVTKAKPSFP